MELNELRKVNFPHLEERYFERMATSLGDKIKLLNYLPPVTGSNPIKILDIGSGGGELANQLSILGYEVTALDASEEAINHIKEVYPRISTIHALANQAHEYGLEQYDAVICSSILHECYSYGDLVHRAGHLSSIVRAVDSFKKALKPGGKLLIRDGVLPDYWEKPATVTLLGDVSTDVVHTYLKMCPFANGNAYGEQGHLVELVEQDGKVFAGNVRSVLEFAYTYTWGLDSYPRETQELYAVMTLGEYSQLLTEQGFTVTESYSYLQPGYPEHLEGVLELKVEGETAPWFDSNAIWVAVLD